MTSLGGASGSRLSQVVLALALGAAVIGFASGTRRAPLVEGTASGTRLFRETQAGHGTGDARPAPTYTELMRAQNGADYERHALAFAAMRADRPQLTDEVVRDPAELESARAARAASRAFAGAPPMTPHPIDQQGYPNCLSCHAQGLQVGERRAPMMSHRAIENCTQCHATAASAAPPPGKPSLHVDNTFEGVAERVGSRALDGAPPQMPHTTFMRESCVSCHGVLAEGIESTHPHRQNCLQCHAPVSEPDTQVPRMPAALLARPPVR